MVILCPHFASLDLRFQDAQEEMTFRESLEDDLVMRSGLSFLFGFMAFGLQAVVVLSPGSYESDNPIQWSLADPRVLTGIAYSVEVLICLLMVMICFTKYHYKRFASSMWDAYILAAFSCGTAVYIFGNQLVTPALVGADAKATFEYSTLESHLLMMMTLVAKTLAFSVYVPVLTHRLWPTLLLMTLVVACMTSILGDGFIYMRIWRLSLFLASTAFSMLGARAKEQNLRTRWRATKLANENQSLAESATTQLVETKALAHGLEVVAHQFCDVVAMLDSEAKLCSNERIDAYFGVEVGGKLFTDYLGEQDAVRFRSLVTRAMQSGLPQCTQMNLQRRFGNSEAQILVVDTGNDHKRHLIGLSSLREELPPAPVEDPQTLPELEFEAQQRPPSRGGGGLARSGIESCKEGSLAFSLTTVAAECRPEKSVQTTTCWGDTGFTCLNCTLPPRPPMSPACRDRVALHNIRAKDEQRRSQRQASKESFKEEEEKKKDRDDARLSIRRPAVAASHDGIWVCTRVTSNMAHFHRALMMKDGDVVDGAGFSSFLELHGRKVVLQSAELRAVSGGELVLEGKGGRILRYRLLPQHVLNEFCLAQGWRQEADNYPPAKIFMPALSEWLVRDEAAEQQSNPPKSSGSDKRCENSTVLSPQFDGVWALMNPPSRGPAWSRTLEIHGNAVIDGDGDLTFFETENGCVTLNGGVVEMDGEFLVRVGRGGQHWYYERRA